MSTNCLVANGLFGHYHFSFPFENVLYTGSISCYYTLSKCWRTLHYIWCLLGYRICYFAHLSIQHSYYEDGLWSHSDINVSLALLKCILCLKYFYIVSGQCFPIWGPEVNNDTWSTGLDKSILNNFLSCLTLVKQKMLNTRSIIFIFFYIFAQLSLPCHSFLEDLY